MFTSEDGLNHYAGVNSYGEVSAIASESFADEQLTETVLIDQQLNLAATKPGQPEFKKWLAVFGKK